MNVITALITGLLIGWGIEWLIDWFYWRRKNHELAGGLSSAQARINTIETEGAQVKNRFASLEASSLQFEGERTNFQSQMSVLEAEKAGFSARIAKLTAENDNLKSQLASLEAIRAQGIAAALSIATEESLIDEAVYTGNVDPTDIEEMAKFKNPLEYVEGIGPVYAEKLRSIELVTCLDLLKGGASRKGREEIATKSAIAGNLILEWVNHVDLYRIKGVGSEYADLLEEAGIDTVVELAQRNPTNLFERMNEVNVEKNLVRKLPTQSQAADWVSQAKSLPRVVTY